MAIQRRRRLKNFSNTHTMHSDEAHYHILKLLEDRPQISQRELAAELGMSLGKTHYCLRALVERGLVKANNFRRSDNKAAYAYLLTPSGIQEKLHITRRFLQRKQAEYDALHAQIAELKAALAEQGG